MKIPKLIHWINTIGGFFIWIVLTISFIESINQLVILVILLCLYLIFYYFLRKSKSVVMAIFLSVFIFLFYILFAQSLVYVENALKLGIVRNLNLDSRLLKYVNENVKGSARNDTFESCCGDPLFYRRTPGTMHRNAFDTNQKNLYSTVVDETGYLNTNRGFYSSNEQIDIFVSGDSVFQGLGGPSLIKEIKEKEGFSIWNLSTGGYSPSQKVKALETFALPKKPKWLILEFYSGNDSSEANEDEICAEQGDDYLCRFNIPEMNKLFLKSSKYDGIVVSAQNIVIAKTKNLSRSNLTLALTSFITSRAKVLLKKMFFQKTLQLPESKPFVGPGYSHFKVDSKNYDKWISNGLENTFQSYRQLLSRLASMPQKPQVILLYNPSSYEIYNGIEIERDKELERRASLQFEALKKFADENQMIFINLLTPLRRIVKNEKVWIYGEKDVYHWSPMGTKVVSKLLYEELKQVIMQNLVKE